MEIEIDTIKIEISKKEMLKLRAEILEILNLNPMISEEAFRSEFPKINEFIKLLQVDVEKIPF